MVIETDKRYQSQSSQSSSCALLPLSFDNGQHRGKQFMVKIDSLIAANLPHSLAIRAAEKNTYF